MSFRSILSILAFYLCSQGHSQAQLSWKQEKFSISLLRHDSIIWKYNYDPAVRPHFHPLTAPDGTLLTDYAPPDHPWHFGLFFNWRDINGLTYWDYKSKKLLESEGVQFVDKIRIKTKPDGSANIILKLNYHPLYQPKNVVLREKRLFSISPPDQKGQYAIEQTSRFRAKTDLLLDRPPRPGEPRGKIWGGYAGLMIRMHRDLPRPELFATSEVKKEKGEHYPWMAIRYPEQKQPFGVLIFDHPKNFNHPTAWYFTYREDRCFFSPVVLYDSPKKMAKGERILLRYIIHITDASLDKDAISTLFAKYTQN
nr:DUF6807 family protein [Allomuricauda sp.]